MNESIKKKINYSLICFFISLTIQGQTTYFSKQYDDIFSFPNFGNNVIIENGKYLVIGNGRVICDSSTIDLFAIDKSSNIEWIKTYNYQNQYVSPIQKSKSIRTSNNEIAVYTVLYLCVGPSGHSTILTKLTVNGDSLWSKQLSGGINDLKLINNGGFIAAGSNFYKEDISPISDFYLTKLDSLGNIIWGNAYGNKNYLESAVSVEFTDDNKYILFGTIINSIQDENQDLYIIKVDTAGVIQWDKRIPKTKVRISGSLKTVDGYFIIYGSEYTDSINDRQAYIAKIDHKGKIVWEKTYGNNYSESIDKIIQLEDGSMIGVGCNWIINVGRNDLLMKFSASGDSLFFKTFADNNSIFSYFSDIKVSNDNGFIITGGYNGDMWLIKLDSLGCLYPNCEKSKY